MAKIYIDKNNKRATNFYLSALKLYPSWRGNYIDILKNLPKIIKLMITNK